MDEKNMEFENCGRVDFYGHRGYGYRDGYAYDSVCIDHPVGRESFCLQQHVSKLEADNAILRSENDSERKMVEVYKDLAKKISENEDKDNCRWEKQLMHNAGQDARLAVIESQLRALLSASDLYINARRVSPLPMPRYNNFEVPITNEGTPIA